MLVCDNHVKTHFTVLNNTSCTLRTLASMLKTVKTSLTSQNSKVLCDAVHKHVSKFLG